MRAIVLLHPLLMGFLLPVAGGAQNTPRGVTGLEFLAGTWTTTDTMIGPTGRTGATSTGSVTYRWGVGDQWLLWDYSTSVGPGVRYVVHGAAVWDSVRSRYRAVIVNNVGQLIQYEGAWISDTVLTFETVAETTGRRGRVSYLKSKSGTVRMTSEHLTGSGAPRRYFVTWLDRIGQDSQQPAPNRADLVRRIGEIQDADFRGQLDRLESLAADLDRFTADPGLERAAHYWRGFALWRKALNRANEAGADFSVVDAEFARSTAEFCQALAIDPDYVEAMIGAASGHFSSAGFHRADETRFTQLIAEGRQLMSKARARMPHNPRLLFLEAGTVFWTPPEYGGDRRKAIAMVERGLAGLPSAEQPDPLEPSWGEAELHMLLAFFLSSSPPIDLRAAERHALDALRLVPHWHYVRNILLPAIEGGR